MKCFRSLWLLQDSEQNTEPEADQQPEGDDSEEPSEEQVQEDEMPAEVMEEDAAEPANGKAYFKSPTTVKKERPWYKSIESHLSIFS